MTSFKGATTKERFVWFVRSRLARTLRGGDVFVLDNLGAHRTAKVREMIKARGAALIFLPANSPDLNPIEECWSKGRSLGSSALGRQHGGRWGQPK